MGSRRAAIDGGGEFDSSDVTDLRFILANQHVAAADHTVEHTHLRQLGRRGRRILRGLEPWKGMRMSLAEFDRGPGGNPVDLVERLAAINDWSFERANESEITLSIKGRHTNYNVSFQWMDELEALHTACAFDLKVPEAKRNEIYRLLAMVNEQLWLGHFDLWSEEGLVMYRDGLVLSGGAEASGRQCEALLENAVSAAERYYPAFQFVVWAGKSAREAMDATLFETAGEA